VHERQIEERVLAFEHLEIEAAPNGAIRGGASALVGGVAAGLATKHITRKLIERDDEGEGTFRHLLPLCQAPLGGRLPELEEAFVYFGIEAGVADEPFVRSGDAPKFEHSGDRLSCAAAGMRPHKRIFPALIAS
jgi:hypothetical protein